MNDHSTNVETEPASPARGTARTLVVFLGIAIVIGLIVSAAIFRSWTLFLIGALVLIPYALLLMAPAWLAQSAKEVQEDSESTDGPGR